MGQITGVITAAVQLGVESVLVRPTRKIGPFQAMMTVEEAHVDELEITDHPVEYGARVSDHAFLRPSEVTVVCGWSNSAQAMGGGGGILGLAGGVVQGLVKTVSGIKNILGGNTQSEVRAVYQNMLQLQASRVPFEVWTGKRVYANMLIKSLRVTTNGDTENALVVTCVCRQVLIARTVVSPAATPPAQQKQPGTTQPVQPQGTVTPGPAPTYNAGAGRGAVNPTRPGP